MPEQHTVVFLDANIFAHCIPLKEIDWCTALDVATVTLMVAPVTVSEVDKLKATGNTSKIRQRASAAIKLLDEACVVLSFPIRTGVDLQFYENEHDDYSRFRLSAAEKDDRLLMAALHFAEDNPGATVGVIANDGGIYVKATRRKLLALRPAKEWIIGSKLDPMEEENRKLKAQRPAQPKLDLKFASGDSLVKIAQPAPPFYDDGVLRQCDTKIRARYKPSGPEADYLSGSVGIITTATYDAYLSDFESFYASFVDFAQKWLDYQQILSRVVSLHLRIFNNGDAPATAIRLLISAKGPAKLMTAVPASPAPPKVPGTFVEWRKNPLGLMHEEERVAMISSQGDALARKIDQDRFGWRVKSKLSAEFNSTVLQHRDSDEPHTLFAYFSDYSEMKGINLSYELYCNESRESVEGSLQVKIAKGTRSDAIFRIPLLGM